MTEFNPGDGWRRLAKGERDQDEMIVYYGDEGSTSWVRVPPVPPLPTAPYTVIRVTWNDGPSSTDVLTLVGDRWGDYTAGNLSRNITGFEVLAEPRRDGDELIAFNKAFVAGAEAVIDRCREESAHPWAKRFLDALARDLGVES